MSKSESPELMTLDALTRVSNRREMERLLDSETARVNRYDGLLSIILLDLDRFRRINEGQGHEAGDSALSRLAANLRRNMRASDHLGRWEEEAFLVLAPEMELTDAAGFAVKLRRLVAEGEYEGAVPLTASFGVTEYLRGESVEQLIQRAEQALQEAKERGGNRVAAARPEGAQARD